MTAIDRKQKESLTLERSPEIKGTILYKPTRKCYIPNVKTIHYRFEEKGFSVFCIYGNESSAKIWVLPTKLVEVHARNSACQFH